MDCELQKYTVIVTPEAEKQIDKIIEYIIGILKAPQTAHNTYRTLQETIYSLGKLPLRGTVVRRNPWNNYGIRFLMSNNYDVYYLTDVKNYTVYILAVAYSRCDRNAVLENLGYVKDGKIFYDAHVVCEDEKGYNR